MPAFLLSFGEDALTALLLLFYGIDIVLLFCFSIYNYLILYLYRKNKASCFSGGNAGFSPINLKKTNSEKLPFVTVQLPVYNEYYVIDRLLKSVSQLQWPPQKLEIQILDDSTDETSAKIKSLLPLCRKNGLSFSHLRRVKREGYKAGALKAGMKQARGELIAVFDADFTPPPDFLLRTVPYFAREDIGMVQTRWGHINANYSLLTRAQALGIDGHFVLEQCGRNANKLWINFNGTAGIWRRRCILDAGNWQGDTLTEDLDLSYRAELAGWNFCYIADIVSPAEIPSEVTAFRRQQYRWCKGSIQTAKKLIKRIRNSDFSWKIKSEAVVRLLKYSVHPLMTLNMLLSLPLLVQSQRLSFSIFGLPISTILIIAAFLCIGSLSSIFFYIYAQNQIYSDWKKRTLWFPALMILGAGICMSNTRAYLEALLKKKATPFLRTPKLGIRTRLERQRYLPKTFEAFLLLELGMGIYCAYTAYYSLYYSYFIFTGLMSIYSCGFFYLSLKGILEFLLSKRLPSLPKRLAC